MSAVFKAQVKFHSVSPTKNEDYAMVKWLCPEYHLGVVMNPPVPNLFCLISAEEIAFFSKLKPNDVFSIDITTSAYVNKTSKAASTSYTMIRICDQGGKPIYENGSPIRQAVATGS